MIYLDASALFKRYYEEPDSPIIRDIVLQTTSAVAASLSYAEVFSALNRKLREQAIERRAYLGAAEEFEGDWSKLEIVPPFRGGPETGATSVRAPRAARG